MPSFPTIRVEVAFAVNTTSAFILDDAVKGVLDTAALSDEVWTDITEYARSISTRRGASRATGPTIRFEAGTLSMRLDNSDRRFDPTNTSGPYVVGGVSQVTPMRAIRILADYAGVSYSVFSGFIDDWEISFSGPSVSECMVTATDATKVLSDFNREPQDPPVGAGELTGTRIHRILDSVDWPVGMREIAAGQSTLQASELSGPGWDEIAKVQDAEFGRAFIDGRGYVVFQDRHASMNDPRSRTVQAAFGDTVGTLPFTEHDIVYDDDILINVARATRTGGAPQVVEDLGSRQQYLTHSFDKTDLPLETDEAAADYAAFVLHLAREPELRFTQLRVSGHEDDALFAQMLGREIGDRISLTRSPPSYDPLAFDINLADVRANNPAGFWIYNESPPEPVPDKWRYYYPGGGGTAGNKHTTLGPIFPVSPDEVIRVTLDHFQIAAGYELRFGVRWFDASGAPIYYETQGVVLPSTPDSFWYTSTVDCVAVDGAALGVVAMFASTMGSTDSGQMYVRNVRAERGIPSVTRECFIAGVNHEIPGPNEWRTTWELQSATKWAFMVVDDPSLGTLDNNVLAH